MMFWKADDRRPHPGGGGLHPQHYTGLFTDILGIGWGFDPILADGGEHFRAVELLGTIAMMLTGAFPMVTLIRRYLGKPWKSWAVWPGWRPAGAWAWWPACPTAWRCSPL